MARKMPVLDSVFLAAALEGLEMQKQRINEQISFVRSMIGQPKIGRPAKLSVGAVPAPTPITKGRRNLSQAALKRISNAQKKRWAEFHKNKAATAVAASA